jgi:hypothetical protein
MRSRHRPSPPVQLARVSKLLAIIVLGACGGSDSDDPGCLSAGGVYQRGKEPYPGANRGLVCCAGLTAYDSLPDGVADGMDREALTGGGSDVNAVNAWDWLQNYGASPPVSTLMHHNCLTAQDPN